MAITIKAEADFKDAKDGLEDLAKAGEKAGEDSKKSADRAADASKDMGRAAENAADTVEMGAKDAETAVNNLAEAEKQAGQAAVQAGESSSQAKQEQANASRAAEKAARDSEAAEKDAAAAAEIRKLRASEAAKELSEGLSRAVETFARTGDVGESLLNVADGAAKAVVAFNPMVGATAMAATNMAKFVKSAWEAKSAAEAAAAAEAKHAAEVEKAAKQEGADAKAKDQADLELRRIQDRKKSYEELAKEIEDQQDKAAAYGQAIQKLEAERKFALSSGDQAGVDAAAKQIREMIKIQEEALERVAELQESIDQSRKNSADKKKKDDEAALDAAGQLKQIEEEREARRRQAALAEEKSILNLQGKQADAEAKAKDQNLTIDERKRALQEVREIEERILQLRKEGVDAAKAEEDQKKRVAAEVERIKGIEEEVAKTRGQLEEEVGDIEKILTGQVDWAKMTTEEQNAMLRKMETAKRRILELDRQAAAERREADRQASERAEEEVRRKEEFSKTQEGQALGAMASDPRAIAERIAKDTGRKRGTVEQMMRRGDISEADMAAAARKNYEDLYKQFQQQGQGMVVSVQGQNATLGSVINRQDLFERELAQLRAQQNAMLNAARAREEATRRRQNGR